MIKLIRRTNEASRFNSYKLSKVVGLRSKNTVISKRDDL